MVKPSAKSFAYATPNPVNENSPVQFIASSNGVSTFMVRTVRFYK
nr:hypothetical protein [Candidatus Brachybacter algidus]